MWTQRKSMKYLSYLRFYTLVLLCSLVLKSGVFAAAAASMPADEAVFPDLPTVAQNTDVHTISRTYCKSLWAAAKETSGYNASGTDTFAELFENTVAELALTIKRIADNQPIMISGLIPDSSWSLEGLDDETKRSAIYFDNGAKDKLTLALNSLRFLGKHKGGSDHDAETNASVNEVFVYVWKKVSERPEEYLERFLMQLADAAPTCIQGYTVRMLCTIHPPKLPEKESGK